MHWPTIPYGTWYYKQQSKKAKKEINYSNNAHNIRYVNFCYVQILADKRELNKIENSLRSFLQCFV